MRRHGVALALTLVFTLSALTGAPTGAVGAEARGQASSYTHPTRGFTLVFPPGVESTERRDRGDLSLRSNRGYVINVQTGDASPHVPLNEMIGRLEAQYLGDARPWRVKLDEREETVAGLAARSAVYEGSGSRAEVLIARGAKTDFVFMFFAPPRSFEDLNAEFRRILAAFQPGKGEVALAPSAEPSAPAPMAMPVIGVEAVAPVGGDAQRLSDAALGYVVDYPAAWEMVRPSAFAVVFGGREGTPAYPLSVSIQNVSPPRAATPIEAVSQVYESLKQQLKESMWDAAYFGEGPYTYDKAGMRLDGRQFLVNYTDAGQRYKQLTVVLPRPDGAVAHIWSYRAPQDRFHTYWPIVENMLRSWTIAGGGEQGARR